MPCWPGRCTLHPQPSFLTAGQGLSRDAAAPDSLTRIPTHNVATCRMHINCLACFIQEALHPLRKHVQKDTVVTRQVIHSPVSIGGRSNAGRVPESTQSLLHRAGMMKSVTLQKAARACTCEGAENPEAPADLIKDGVPDAAPALKAALAHIQDVVPPESPACVPMPGHPRCKTQSSSLECWWAA